MAYTGRVVPGVSVAGVALGGMTQAEVEQTLVDRFTAYDAGGITVRAAGKQWRLAPAELGWRRSVAATTAAALAVGHEWNPLVRLREQAAGLVFGATIAPESVVDEARLAAAVRSLAAQLDQPARDATLTVDPDARVRVEPAQPERRLEQAAATDLVRDRLLRLSREPVDLPVREALPSVDDSDLVEARDQAERLLQAPITLTFGDRSWRLDRRALAAMLTTDAQLDPAKLTAYVTKLASELDWPARNARFNWLDGRLVVVQDSSAGRQLDVAAAVAAIRQAATGDRRKIALPVRTIAPAIGLSDTSKLVIEGLIEAAVTDYGGTVPERVHNVELAASRLNGVVVAPGETFSFNQSVGSTALANGYQIGWGIAGSGGAVKTVPSVAGGICQVATTLFQAVFWAGYQIEERNYHLYWIPRYGAPPKGLKGLDATVDEESQVDFEFTNNSPHYLLIQSHADRKRGQLTFALYGVKPAWRVTVEGPTIDKVIPADQRIVRQADPTMPHGATLNLEHAEDGFRSTITRTVRDGSAEPRVLRLTSIYQPSRNVVLVGTRR